MSVSTKRIRLLTVLSLAAAATPAWAGDYYVDANSGSDVASGLTWGQAWQTITHAVASVPGGDHTIHIAAGVHDAALGEAFPITVRTGLTLVGAGNATVLDGGGASTSLIHWGLSGGGGAEFRGLWLRNAATGMEGTQLFNYDVILRDVEISDMTARGIHGTAEFWDDPGAYPRFVVTLDRVRIHDCAVAGAYVEDNSIIWVEQGEIRIDCYDSEIWNNGAGLACFGTWGADSDPYLVVARSWIHDNGLGIGASDTSILYVEDSVIESNGTGISAGSGNIKTSTIASNTGTGLSHFMGTFSAPVRLNSCILYGNGDDLDSDTGNVLAEYNDIGDGDYSGADGNISTDPLFADPLNGDYRLAAGSPCIDTGDPTLPRDCDGSRADMGAVPSAVCFETFCAGDGSATPCPCGNAGGAGNGCDNAQATGGVRLTATGDPTLNDVVLHGSGFPPTSNPSVVAIRSSMRENGGLGSVFGDGLVCVASPVVRFAATFAADGASRQPISHGVGAGTFHYQLWYRSNPASFCDPTAAFNLSNGLSIAWP